MSANYISLLAAWSWTLITFVDHVQDDLEALDGKHGAENHNTVNFKTKFRDFIQFHAEVKG